MKASEYKDFKGIRKESLRDNMTDIEVILTDLGEVAKRGGNVSKIARETYELETGESAITSDNSIGGRYNNMLY